MVGISSEVLQRFPPCILVVVERRIFRGTKSDQVYYWNPLDFERPSFECLFDAAMQRCGHRATGEFDPTLGRASPERLDPGRLRRDVSKE